MSPIGQNDSNLPLVRICLGGNDWPIPAAWIVRLNGLRSLA